MKTPAIILLLLCGMCTLNAQEGRLAAFSAIRLDEGSVQILWTMKAGVSCQSPEVQISTDSIEFRSIYRYPGVCGGGATEESFSWIHSNAPSNADAYYRLKIDEGEFSKVQKILFDRRFADRPIVLYPNPTAEYLKIAFKKEFGRLESIELFDHHGRELNFQLLSRSNDGLLQIDVSVLNPQWYFFRMRFEGGRQESLRFLKYDP